tara:strand:+ start:123 stop:1250 length:1128 start_codon:yes stop_codon:yes gene_type:complete
MDMTIKELKEKGLILFETVSGSRAYGTDLPTSDTDIRGVFIMPEDQVLGKGYVEQVNDKKNDIIYYEVGRFLDLLNTNNPNILELLNAPEDCIQYKHPLFDIILEHKGEFITKQCRNSFGGYAVQQIKKARGLNKRIVNPVEVKRKNPIDFCYVIEGYNSQPITEWLKDRGVEQDFCGVVNIPNARDMYALFVDYAGQLANTNGVNHSKLGYKGIVSQDSNQLKLSSIPKGEVASCVFSYNKDGYTSHCKDYKEYWEWVEDRNEDRYNDNANHGKGYDGKNLMHCHRLLDMSLEILNGKGINVRRPNREELLSIRRGEMDYGELVDEAERKMELMDKLFTESKLPSNLPSNLSHNILLDIRKKFYKKLVSSEISS